MDTETTNAQRANAAAEAIAAEGETVTARAVRTRAGVSMKIATDAAREWNNVAAQTAEVPDLPDVVLTRFQAAWREAVVLARAELAEQRVGWEQRVRDAENDRDVLETDLAAVEEQQDTERAARAAMAAAHAEQLEELEDQLSTLRTRADRAEARVEAVEAERDRLILERDAAIEEARSLER